MLIVFLFYAWNVFRFYMSYLIYYLQFILPFVIYDLIYHFHRKCFSFRYFIREIIRVQFEKNISIVLFDKVSQKYSI